MEHIGKERKLYNGIAIPFILILVIPVGFYYFFNVIFTKFTDHTAEVIIYMSLGFAGLVGTLFNTIFIIDGFIHDLFISFIMRLARLFSEIKVFKKKAFAWYFEDFKENGGIIIWIFLLIYVATLCMCIYGFSKFGMWYASLK